MGEFFYVVIIEIFFDFIVLYGCKWLDNINEFVCVKGFFLCVLKCFYLCVIYFNFFVIKKLKSG